MTEAIAVEIACKLSASVSGWNRYVRVNDYVIDTVELQCVAMAWPRMARGAFPIRNRGDSVRECLSD